MQTIGPYQLLEELGRGAMGVVFRGFDPAIGRPVAIKIIQTGQFAGAVEQAELKLRFAREASAAGKLSHPNIVTIYQLGDDGDTQYLVPELVNGSSLEKTLSNRWPQDRKMTVSIVAQVADALDYAHSEGIVHRDVKPANILVRPDGKVKITDFGIARIASQTVTKTGFTFGTPAYMSPEQIMSARVGGGADQFSLGVIAYQMLSGKMPFAADTGPALMFQIMSAQPPLLHTVNPAVSPRTSEVIGKALAKNPDDRFASCKEFARKLAESFGENAEAAVTMHGAAMPRAGDGPSGCRGLLAVKFPQVLSRGSQQFRILGIPDRFVGGSLGKVGQVGDQLAETHRRGAFTEFLQKIQQIPSHWLRHGRKPPNGRMAASSLQIADDLYRDHYTREELATRVARVTPS